MIDTRQSYGAQFGTMFCGPDDDHRDRVVIVSDMLRAEIAPEMGGRILSLKSMGNQREWLWRNPYLQVRVPVGGESYTGCLDAGGWDEIAPSISRCVVMGNRMIPDHGDIVRHPARVLSAGPDHCLLCTELESLPLRFTRLLRLQGSGLMVDYALESLGSEAIPCLWSAHPLFAIEPGTRIEVGRWDVFDTASSLGEYCSFDGMIPDFRSPDFKPFACKMFSRSGSVDRVGIRHPDGDALEFEWDADEIPHLGLWLNLGAWSGCGSPPYLNIGIEPTSSPHDSLADAMDCGDAMILEAGETRRWTLRVHVHSNEKKWI